ncbi:MAG: PAS domain S-box protein [Desulfobacterota bacterium]|nr:PAS domain S-box protein [Thermodesulfobacteriota bacterium]
MNLHEILSKYRNRMVEEWVHRLHTEVSDRYRGRPLDELFYTVSMANEANFAVLIHSDFSKINQHIQFITNLRLEGGFSLSEVQNAYELYRTVLLPILPNELDGKDLHHALKRLNETLFYTITKFSNYFQALHEKHLREYAKNLEGEVENRTRQLAESESKYRVLVEEINDGYFVNQKGRIVFANPAFCDLHGYTYEEMLGKPYEELIAPESLPFVRRLYEDRMAGVDTKDLYIYFRRHKNGSLFPTENKVKRILFQGEVAIAGICRDITERIEAEKRMRESERLAHIGQLTTSLAHEIRNPLSSVKMNSQIILKNMAFDGNDKRRMEIIVHEISRLERILDEMLDFARPIKLKLEPVRLPSILESSLEIMEAKIKEKGLLVQKRWDEDLPPLPLDPEKMVQALFNVLLNAVEAVPEGGWIEVVAHPTEPEGSFVQIEVNDNGPGICPEDLPFIFDPFFSKKKKGTGLGLWNVKKIMEAHGGSAVVVPRSPHGTSVRLHLPVLPARRQP